MFAVSIETTSVTLCSHVVSVMLIMSVSKKSDNSEARCKILYDSVRQQGESIYALVIVCHYINLFCFLVKKNFAKQG